ncbi:MAG: cytochrome d ubiquinol oxidase subunit II [Sandaracinaceae bacterium]|nr:cytochrome d ubiquinol oxidase subunit II [Sandaracinaceae bacterium]
MDLATLWFVILGVLLAGYAILDGFDLGVGILYPLVRGETERRLALNSIGPLWDGNEVWLVTFGGALFAAFPEAYATALSALYFPVIVLLFSLIGRAISIEFRSKRPSKAWRAYWDASFALSSATIVLIFGVAAGNMMRGIPLDAAHEHQGTLLGLFDGYSLAVGVFALSVCAMHGSIFLYLKTEGALQAKVHGWMWRTFFVFLAMYALVTALTLAYVPHATANFARWPAAWIVVVLEVLAIANIPRAIHHGRPGYAFVSSSCTIAALVFLFGMALFPSLVVSSSEHPSLTIENAASSEATLGLMAIIAAIGIPFVATYTAIVYWVFRGKVKLGKFSY